MLVCLHVNISSLVVVGGGGGLGLGLGLGLEIIFTVLSQGHRVSPVMQTRYVRLLWLARVAQRPGVTQVFTRAIWESGGRPLRTVPRYWVC